MAETSQEAASHRSAWQQRVSSVLAETPICRRLLNRSGSWWPLVTLTALLLSLVTRAVESNLELFDCDGYGMMESVEKSFAEYAKTASLWAFPLRVHHWLAHRLLGGHLFGFRILPAMSSLATLLIAYWGLRRYWHSNLRICFFALLVLIFNAHSLYLAHYMMFTYGNSLLVSTCLFFLFLHLSQKTLPARWWIWISILSLPSAFFSNMTVVVPVATGVFSVIVYRWSRLLIRRDRRGYWHAAAEMLPLLIFPLTYIIVYSMHPFTNLGPVKRPDMNWLFLARSPYPLSVCGALRFAYENTLILLRGALLPTSLFPDLSWRLGRPIILMAGLVTVGIPIIIQFTKRKVDSKMVFTVFYVLVTYSAILAGGLAGLYPFGNIRYSDFLLVPVITLIAYSVSVIAEWSLLKDVTARKNARIVPLALSAMLLLCGTYWIVFVQYKRLSDTNSSNLAALENIRTTAINHVLVSEFSKAVLAVRTPDLRTRTSLMAWDKENIKPSAQLVEALTENVPSGKRSVLIVAPSSELFFAVHPLWAAFATNHFHQVGSIDGLNIWAGIFERSK